jgi:hypothetical protein
MEGRATMKKFETGKTYTMRSICDHECVWGYKVKARTEKTVTLTDEHGKETKCRVSNDNGGEFVRPLGRYSMCPILRA